MRPDEQPPPPMSFPAPPMMWPNPYLMSPYHAAQMAQWYNATMQGGNINTSPVNQANIPAETDGLLLENQAREGGDGQDLELPDDMGINGGGGFALMAENRRRRDAVDYVYMLMMLMFLGAIGYMAGSFYQFIIFFAGVAVILLNQGGWFTVQRRQVNLPQEEQHRDEQRRDNEDNTDGNEDREENQEREDDEIHPAQEDQDANNDRPGHRQGTITTIIVFVTSFFSSLLPQQVPEIEAN